MKHFLLLTFVTLFSALSFAGGDYRPENEDIPYSGHTPPGRLDEQLRKKVCGNYADVVADSYFLPPHQAQELHHTYERALQHHPDAQAKLGDQYIDGDVLPQNWQQGICWYRAAAQHGSAYARYWLGIFYQNGTFVPQDAQTATAWFTRASKAANHVAAERQVAERYADRKSDVFNMNQALYWYERAARSNDVKAQLALGDFYVKSHNAGDIRRALSWYGKAADRGSVEAEYNIGQIYYRGEGITQDYTEAHDWFMRAATQGYAPAQYDLAQMYYRGQGVERDNFKAYAWLVTSNAAKQNPEAAQMLEGMTKEFTPEHLKIATRMANDYKARYR